MPYRTEHHQLSTGTNSLGGKPRDLLLSLGRQPGADLPTEGSLLVCVSGPYQQGLFSDMPGTWVGWVSSRYWGICTKTKQGSSQRLPSGLVTWPIHQTPETLSGCEISFYEMKTGCDERKMKQKPLKQKNNRFFTKYYFARTTAVSSVSETQQHHFWPKTWHRWSFTELSLQCYPNYSVKAKQSRSFAAAKHDCWFLCDSLRLILFYYLPYTVKPVQTRDQNQGG